jgi:hypothetical protein
MSWHLPLAVAGMSIALAAGCAAPAGPHGSQTADAEIAPAPPVLTPEQERDKAQARQDYMACLKQAAHFAGERAIATGDVAEVIAPMCYPQFSRYEIAAAVGMDGRVLRYFDRQGDKRQLEFAAEAIRQEHGLAALTNGQ